MKYFVKEAGVVDGALRALKFGAPKAFGNIVKGEGGAISKTFFKYFGSKGSLEGIGKHFAGEEAKGLTTAVKSQIPESVLKTPNMAPEMKTMMKQHAGDEFRIRDYQKANGPLKGIWEYGKKEIAGIGENSGAGGKWFKRNFANMTNFVTPGGEVASRSLAGKVGMSAFEIGGTALYAKDAFGEVQPGETRAGKILGAAAGTYGFASARKGIAGLVRSTVGQMAGERLGNLASGGPSVNQFNTGIKTY